MSAAVVLAVPCHLSPVTCHLSPVTCHSGVAGSAQMSTRFSRMYGTATWPRRVSMPMSAGGPGTRISGRLSPSRSRCSVESAWLATRKPPCQGSMPSKLPPGKGAEDAQLARPRLPRSKSLNSPPWREHEAAAARIPGDAVGWPEQRVFDRDRGLSPRHAIHSRAAGVGNVQRSIRTGGDVVQKARLEAGEVDKGQMAAAEAIEAVHAIHIRGPECVAGDEHATGCVQRCGSRSRHEPELLYGAAPEKHGR